MHLLRYILFTLCITCTAVPSKAQQEPGTVRGTVVDAQTEEPLVGVSVFLENTLLGAATDDDGSFVIEGVPPGAYGAHARFIGYREQVEPIEIGGGETETIDFELHVEPVSMTAVEVAALRPDLQPEGQLEAQEIRETTPRDAGEVMRALPGVNAARRGPIGLDPNVRGLVETEVGAYVDGVRRFPAGPLRMDSQVAHFDPSVIERIEVVKGPYALTWGAGNMGAIRVQTKTVSPAAGLAHGYLRSSYETNENASGHTGALFGSKSDFTYWLHGAYRTGSDYETGSGRVIAADYMTAEVRGKTSYHLSPTSRVTVAGGYQDQRNIDYAGRLLNADHFRAGDVSAQYELSQPGELLRNIDALVYWHRVDHGMDNDGKPTAEAGTFPNGDPRPPLIIEVDAEMENIGGRLATTLNVGGGQSIKLGGDVYHAYRNARRPFFVVMNGEPRVPPFYVSDRAWPGVTVVSGGLFANIRQLLGEVSLSATGRVDVAHSDAEDPSDVFLEHTAQVFLEPGATVTASDLASNETNLSAAVTASVPITANWDLSTGLGSVARTADALERYSDRFPASKAQTSAEFQGNPFLEPERSTQFDLWLDGFYPRFQISLNGFARYMSNYVTLTETDIDPLLPLSPSTVFTYVNGSAFFFGGEARLSYAVLDQLTASASLAYLWGEDRELGEPAFGVTPLRSEIGLRYESPGGEFFAESSVLLVDDQDRVAAARGETPTPGYTRVDARLGYELFGGVTLLGGIRNLTDEAYVNHLNARNPFTTLPIAEPGRTFFGSVNLEF